MLTTQQLTASAGPSKATLAQGIPITLFAGRLASSATEEEVRSLFSPLGSVDEVIIIKGKDGKPKNSAFIRMSSITEADKAVREINEKQAWPGSTVNIQVRYANGEAERLGLTNEAAEAGTDEGTLFLGSVPTSLSSEAISSLLAPFGTVTNLNVLKNESGESKGCAFAKFAFKEEALRCIAALHNKHVMENGGRSLQVRFANANKKSAASQLPAGAAPGAINAPVSGIPPQTLAMINSLLQQPKTTWKEYTSPDGHVYYHNEMTGAVQWNRPVEMDLLPRLLSQQVAGAPANPAAPSLAPKPSGMRAPPGATCFLYNIPHHWKADEICQLFGSCGKIASCYVHMNGNSNKGYAFLGFEEVQSSVRAVATLNNTEYEGRKISVTIKKGEEEYAEKVLTRPV